MTVSKNEKKTRKEFGSPYTTSEARAVANDPNILLDRPYVKDIMLWLCNEVERLQEAE